LNRSSCAFALLFPLSATAGALVGPRLDLLTQPVPGEPLELQLTLPPGTTRVAVLRGAPGTSCPAILGGECLALATVAVLADLPIAQVVDGRITLLPPTSVPVGISTSFQVVTFTSNPATPVMVSNPVQAVFRDHLPAFGVWTDDFGSAWEIDDQTVRGAFGAWHIRRFDGAGRVVAQNDAGNTYFPGAYSRFDFAFLPSGVWMCQSVYDGATLQDAQAAPASDPSDPASGGCGAFGFPWSRLEADPLELAGDYVDEWGTPHDITSELWEQPGFSTWAISRYSNLDRFVIARNAADAPFAAGRWSRFDWVEAGGELYYCQTAYDAATEYVARTTAAADPTDPAVGGCGAFGFAWTRLD
jgi:hypothetical protein